MTPPLSANPPSRKAMSWRDKLSDSVKRNRTGLLTLFALLVALGAAVAIPENSSLFAWGILAPFGFVLYLAASRYRQTNQLTWPQAIGQLFVWCVFFGVILLILVGIGRLVEWIKSYWPHWRTFLPILLVLGIYAVFIGLGLLVLYVAVRVVRAAWKSPMADSLVTRQQLESAVEEILERHRLDEDELDDGLLDTGVEDATGYVSKEHRRPCDRCRKEQAEVDLYPGEHRERICRDCWRAETDELETLRRAVDQQRGYADFFDWPDKRQKESGILANFAEAFRKAGGSIVGEHLTEPGRDPPDAVALSQSGAKIGIEFVELVDQSLVEQQKRHPERAQWRAWSREELRQALLTRVAKKDRAQPGPIGDLSEYWTVVHTDEPALTPEAVTQHLAGFHVGPCRLVTRCFLLMSYINDGYPLIEVAVRREA